MKKFLVTHRSLARHLSTPGAGPKGPLTKEEITKGLQYNEKYRNYMKSINSVSPLALVHDFLPSEEVRPPPGREIGLLSEMPADQNSRRVLIEPKPRKSVQQGEGKAHQWMITWPHEQKWTNQLMGWTSGSDPMCSSKLHFDSREDAIAYAERSGWKYRLKAATSLDTNKPGQFNYDQNFLPEAIRQRLKIEGKNNKIFANSKYGKSHWFMPLNFHGTAEVEQHGPTVKK